jgi:hypothetical protein
MVIKFSLSVEIDQAAKAILYHRQITVFSVQFSVFSIGRVMAFRSFEELEVWKRSSALAVVIYQVLQPAGGNIE